MSKALLDRLPAGIPSAAEVFQGLGAILYHTDDPASLDIACNCFRQALAVRIEWLGERHLETAVARNNHAAALVRLKDPSAMSLFVQARDVLLAELGSADPRTVLVEHNIAEAFRGAVGVQVAVEGELRQHPRRIVTQNPIVEPIKPKRATKKKKKGK